MSEPVTLKVAEAHLGGYTQTVTARDHSWTLDEPVDVGTNQGPAPFEMLMAALGSCTTITLRMYADRKGWPLEHVEADVSWTHGSGGESFAMTVHMSGPLDEEQRARLTQIASRCPVHRALSGGSPIATDVTFAGGT